MCSRSDVQPPGDGVQRKGDRPQCLRNNLQPGPTRSSAKVTMYRVRRARRWIARLCLVCLMVTGAAGVETRASAQTGRSTVLIGLDGFSPELPREAAKPEPAQVGPDRSTGTLAHAGLSHTDLSQLLHHGHWSLPRASRHRLQHHGGLDAGALRAARQSRHARSPLVGRRALSG